jgi:glycosyltransferase involved in cell wall biosynthesis
VRFLFVGDGILRRSLELWAGRLGLAGRVKFAGLVPAADIPAHLATADLLVHASLREGLPRAVPQALLAGTPVVAFDIDGTREVIRDGETGLLVSPRDVGGLAAAIRRMACEPELAGRTAEAGRKLASQLFPSETMVRRLDEVYAGLMVGSTRSV